MLIKAALFFMHRPDSKKKGKGKMKKSTKWFSLAAALSVTAIVGTGCSISGGDSHKDTKTAAETKQSDDTSSKKTTKTENSDFVLESKYFNDIKEVNGLETIQNPTNTLALVNKTYTLPGDYKPNDLVIPKVEFSFTEKIEKRYIRKPAADALAELFSAGKKKVMTWLPFQDTVLMTDRKLFSIMKSV